jgi:hypothetical protein
VPWLEFKNLWNRGNLRILDQASRGVLSARKKAAP